MHAYMNSNCILFPMNAKFDIMASRLYATKNARLGILFFGSCIVKTYFTQKQ